MGNNVISGPDIFKPFYLLFKAILVKVIKEGGTIIIKRGVGREKLVNRW